MTRRTADRGITSFQGRPAEVDPATFYGNPDLSDVQAEVNLVSGMVEHRAGRMTIRNRTMVGDYDRFYQNYVPGAVDCGHGRRSHSRPTTMRPIGRTSSTRPT